MKQVYSTGPFAGSAALRATSHGVGVDEAQVALASTAYTPPSRSGGESPLPVRLALLKTTSAGRVLSHVAPNGGTYFAHTLLNVPATADAQTAIQTWGSPLWQRHDPDTAGDLPELPYLPVADVLDDESLTAWLKSPTHQDMLEFVLSALLGTPPTTRIFVAASADDVARVVYAVTRALPHGLLDDLTFSTYEPNPLSCTARLIGHDTGSPESDLPPACYGEAGVAYNPATGRKSQLAAEVPFAAFAAKALAEANTTALDDFRATWQRLGLNDPRQFDLVYRLTRGTGGLTKEESATAAQHPTLAAWISARGDALKQFLEWALDDAQFAHHAFSRVIVPLRQKAEAVAKLSEVVRAHGLAAVKRGDKQKAASALEVILPMAAPAKANAVWGEVLNQITDPASLTWEMRWYLLPRFVRFKHPTSPATTVDPALANWLDVPAEKLSELLALELPRAYHIAAARACLVREGEPTPTFARAVAPQPALVQQLLQPHDGVKEESSAKLFETLLAEVPTHPWFDDVVANAQSFPAARRNRFFEAVLATGKVDADRLIRTRGETLLGLFAGQSGLDVLGRQFLASPPADVFTDRTILGFLGKLLDEPQVGDDVKKQVSAVQAVRSFLDQPEFTGDSLSVVSAALTLEPAVLPPTAKEQVLDVVNAGLSARGETPEFQQHLEVVLLHLGPLATGSAALYRELLRRQRQRRDFGKQAKTVHGFLAVALGASQSADVAKVTEGLEAEAFTIASEAGTKGGRRVLDDIDARTKDWPKSARTQWGFLIEAVRPKGNRAVRDLVLFAAGATLASTAWFVVAQLVK
ncbi:MAG TPA: hypothetical protein VMZ71_03850 [Gemmataceae bacterium]|nr:hypothetical protein [Gemmataceae bacterium]